MKRTLGFLSLVLGGLGLAACLAALIAVWMYRTPVLQSSLEVVDAADDGLTVLDEKVKRAGEVVGMVKEVVAPVAQKLLAFADKAKSTSPEDEKELKRIEEELAERFRQVDAFVQTSETVVALVNKTARLTRRGASEESPAGDLRSSGEVLGRLAKGLKKLRNTLAKIREDKQVRKEIVDTVVGLARDVDNELNLLQDTLGRVGHKAAELQIKVTELHADIPIWINSAAVTSSVVLAWMSLGQLALLCLGWRALSKSRSE